MLQDVTPADFVRRPASTVLVTVYLFTFRYAIKTAAFWGAFEIPRANLILQKFGFSLLVLIGLPILLLAPFAQIALLLKTDFESRYPEWLVLAMLSSAILPVAQFPRAPKHWWSLLVQAISRTNRVEGWLNQNQKKVENLPHPLYSLQVIVLCGLAPIALLLHYRESVHLVGGALQLQLLYTGLLAGQITIFLDLGKKRGLFYLSDRPRFLISKRMLITLPIGIVWPILLGLIGYAALRQYEKAGEILPLLITAKKASSIFKTALAGSFVEIILDGGHRLPSCPFPFESDHTLWLSANA